MGRFQQTLAGFIEKIGKTLRSGNVSTVRLCPEFAGKGRYFEFRSKLIPASIDFAKEFQLCTALFKDGVQIHTVEHLLSVLEANGIDNCKIEIHHMVADDQDVQFEVEVPAIGCQWFSTTPLEGTCYAMHIASSRTFCIYEEVECLCDARLIKGSSLDNVIVCSASEGWLNPPLRFPDEPCRHKLLDFGFDLLLFLG